MLHCLCIPPHEYALKTRRRSFVRPAAELLLFDTIVPCQDLSWVFNPTTDTWKELVVHGESPSPRAFSSLASSGWSLYLFGGLGKDKTKLNDLWELSIATSTWKLIPISNPPSARYGMSLLADQWGAVFIVGGKTAIAHARLRP